MMLQILWIFPTFSLFAIAMLMRRRGEHQLYPGFWLYILFQAGSDLALWILSKTAFAGLYFYSFWIANTLSTIFAIVAVHEMYHCVLSAVPAWRSWGERFFKILSVTCVLASLSLVEIPDGTFPAAFVMVVLPFNQALILVQCLVTMLTLGVASLLKIPLAIRPLGVGIGLGINSSLSLVVIALRSFGGPELNPLFIYGQPIAFNLAVLAWCWYFLPVQSPLKQQRLTVESMNLLRRTTARLQEIGQ